MPSKENSIYLLGQLSFTGSIFLFNIVTAFFLSPEKMGLWQTIVLISTYSLFFQAGVINGLGREIPFYRGNNNQKQLQEVIASATQYVSLLLGLFCVSAVILYFSHAQSLIFFILALAIAKIINNLSVVLLRSYQDFSKLGIHQLISAVTLFLGMYLLYKNNSLENVVIGMTLALLLPTSLAFPYILFKKTRSASTFKLMKIGLPIYAAGLLFSLMSSIDRWIILYFLNTESLGLYTLAVIALGIIMLVPTLVSNLMYPKLAYAYGVNRSISDLFPIVKKLLIINVSLTITVSTLSFLLLYFFIIPSFLPEYLLGRDAMSIVFLTGIILPVGQSFGDLFNVIDYQKYYLKNMALGFIVNLVIGAYLVGGLQLGLTGIAIGTLSGLSIFSIAQYITYKKLLFEHKT